MNHYCPCPGTVPIVSAQLAEVIARQVDEQHRIRATEAAVQWLTEKHEGLDHYEGIHGRPYTDKERTAIAKEVGFVAFTPCPFISSEGCLVGGLTARYSVQRETGQPDYGWLPTFLLRAWDRKLLIQLIQARAVSDSKVAKVTTRELELLSLPVYQTTQQDHQDVVAKMADKPERAEMVEEPGALFASS